MTDKEIVERAKEAEKKTSFGELVHSPISKGVNSAYGIGFIEGMVEYRNSLQEEPVSKLWHDASETPSIFGTYLLIHEGGWCVARYFGKEVPTGNTTGWVEISNNIFIEHPQNWLDLRDLLTKTK